jgi:hypothetical protein
MRSCGSREPFHGTEEDLYELWHDLEAGREARIANLGSDAGVDDV